MCVTHREASGTNYRPLDGGVFLDDILGRNGVWVSDVTDQAGRVVQSSTLYWFVIPRVTEVTRNGALQWFLL